MATGPTGPINPNKGDVPPSADPLSTESPHPLEGERGKVEGISSPGAPANEYVSTPPPAAPDAGMLSRENRLFPPPDFAGEGPPIDERQVFPITLDPDLTAKISERLIEPTEVDIAEIVKGIVAQDHEYYPDGDGNFLTTTRRYFIDRWYRIGRWEFSINRLAGFVRRARGLKVKDIHALSNGAVVREWRKNIFGIEAPEVERTVIPIEIDFVLTDTPTEEEIGKVVQAIVAQDKEFYPDGDADALSTYLPRFNHRYYRAGDVEASLSILSDRVRRARGIKSGDSGTLPDSAVIHEWKKNYFGIEVRKVERRAIPIRLDFDLSAFPTEDEIGKIVMAVVAQDVDTFPNGDISRLTTSLMAARWYQIGQWEFTLRTLAGRVRQLRGYKQRDTQSLTDLEILNEWRLKLFGLEEILTGLPIQIDFEISQKPTEEEIRAIVRAIVEQDTEFYPGGVAAPMSVSAECLKRRYVIGRRELSLDTLTGWVRMARGFKAGDKQLLSGRDIISQWRKEIFGLDPLPPIRRYTGEVREPKIKRTDNTARMQSPDFELDLDIQLSQPPTESEIGLIVQAIVAQDAALYPSGDPSPMTTGKKYFNRLYQVGDHQLHLERLAGWVRRARGLLADDTKSLKSSDIIREWRTHLFDLAPLDRPPLEIETDVKLSENPEKDEISRIVRAIVAQDSQLYPGGNAGRMVSRRRYLQAVYLIGERKITLDDLIIMWGKAGGLTDAKAERQIRLFVINEWKRRLFRIDVSDADDVDGDSVQAFRLNSGATYDWSVVALPNRALLEDMLREVLKVQFDSDPQRMTAGQISDAIYEGPNGDIVRGLTILSHYSQARWMDDHPDQPVLPKHKVLGEEGYSMPESVDYFLREIVGYEDHSVADYVLQSAQDFDWSHQAGPNRSHLEDMLREILEIQFDGDPTKMTQRAIFPTTYHDPEGSAIKGSRILTHYAHARWLDDHPGEEDIGQILAMRQKGYRVGDAIAFFKGSVLERQMEADYLLETAQDYDWTMGVRPDRRQLEVILREMIDIQFEGDPGKVLIKEILGTHYRVGDHRKITGTTILNHYSRARWNDDHPGESLSHKQIISQKGYRPYESLDYFFASVLGHKTEFQPDYILESGRGYDWTIGTRPNRALLEEMLLEIFRIQFEGNPATMRAVRIVQTTYQGPGGEKIEGNTLLNHYCYARWLEDHPHAEGSSRVNAVRQKGYGGADSIRYFVSEILGFDSDKPADFILESAAGYDWSPTAPQNKERLDEILCEILDVQFEGDYRKMKESAMGQTIYQSPEGNKIAGRTLLYRYSLARWLADHPEQEGMQRTAVVRQKGYGLGDSLNYFVQEVLGQGRKADWALQAGMEGDWGRKRLPVKAVLENVLKEICEVQFGGKPERIKVATMEKVLYKLGDDSLIKGGVLLELYSCARWLADHPHQERIGRKSILVERGYWKSDSLAHFLREVYFYEPTAEPDYVLEAGRGYDWTPGTLPDKAHLEQILREIFQRQFAGDHKKMSAKAMRDTGYGNPDGVTVRGYRILDRYSHARWLVDRPGAKDIGQKYAIREKGYGQGDSLRYFKEKILGIKPGPATLEEIETWIREHDVAEIIELFADDPAMLIEALSFLKAKEFEGRDVAEFVRNYIGLNVERIRKGGPKKGDENSWEKRRLYILAVIRALESGEQVDLSDANFHNQLNLLIRLSRKSFEENPGRLISELEAEAAKPSHPFVQRLHTEAADYFQATLDFEITGMRTLAYGYQKEGAHFLATHDKAILADEAGMGKSYQVIAAVETLGLKRVLWVTTAANKETLREEILGHADLAGLENPAYRDEKHIDSRDFPAPVKIVISGDPKGRKEQVRGLNGERYVITNYETLVALQKDDPEGYAKLTEGLDVVVVDEAQLTDNPKTLRTNAIHDIPTPRRWLLSATPYQTNPESIWTLLNYLDPQRYPDRKAFKQMYTQSTSGLVLLHSELSNIMLRRTKKDTLGYFEIPPNPPLLKGGEVESPPLKKGGEGGFRTYEEQLADGIPRLPQKVRIPPEQSGAYELSQDQAELIAWMTADFNGWAEQFNQNLPQNAEPIDPESINPLQKFELIHKVIYDPDYFGITTHSLGSPSPFGERVGVRGRALQENPIYAALDKVVARRLAAGEKVILWAWNTAMLDSLEKRYGRLGTRRIDGTVLGEAREKARHDFQELPEVRLLPANYLSGGVGLTLTAAHSAVFVQIPNQYPLLYQAEGRHQRLIGPENVRHAKDQVDVEWMIPIFPAGFVQNIQDPKLAEILSHGTLVEQTRARLEGGEILYNMVMEGYGDVSALEDYFKEGIIRGMGLTNGEKLDYVAHLQGDMRVYAETIRSLLPLWKLVEGTPEAEEKVLQMIEDFRHYPILARRVGEAFQSTSRYYQDDLALITSLFEIKNKYIRTQVLEKLPDLLVKMYSQGQSLAEAAKALKMDRLSPAVFVAQLYLSSGATGQAVANIARELSALRDTPAKRYIEEHFLVGVFGILGKPVAENILRDKETLFDGVKLTERILAVYRLGLLARTRPDLVDVILNEVKNLSSSLGGSFAGAQDDTQVSAWEMFSHAVERAVHQAIAEFAGRTSINVDEMLEANPMWKGTADSLLALIAAWQEFEDDKLLDQAREVYGHLLDGDLREWRLGENNRVHGNGIDYLSDEPAFWEAFAANDVTAIDKVVVAPEKVNATLVKDYIAVLQEFDQEGEAVEGKWVKGQIDVYRALKGKEVENQRTQILEGYQDELRLLGPLLGGGEVSDEVQALLDKYSISYDGSLASKADLQRKLSELRQLTMWMTLDNRFRELNRGKETDWKGLVRLLDSKAKYVRSRKHDKMAEHIETLRDMVSARSAGTATFTDVTIEDTDDPAILARMGTLHPEMTNCFNPNGNPTFNQFVVGALGSKNMKLVVVRAGGEIVAAAMVKVKQLEDESPVLFLERGLYRKGYDFRNEMLGHLAKKSEVIARSVATKQSADNTRGIASASGLAMTLVMDEVRGKPKETDPVVYGTGAYTENEYVESVFGLRRAANVRHRGRVVEHNSPQPPLTLRGGERGSYGIGTSNKTIEAYIAELQTNGVTTVVDVRGSPYSRYRPHFNRDRMAASLKSAGVEYVWLGDTLGNPKDEHGERTLDGFKDRHMKTPEYDAGIRRLMEIIRAALGKVAVTCAEGAEADCHRKFILEDVRTRLETNAGGLVDTEDNEPMIHNSPSATATADKPSPLILRGGDQGREFISEPIEASAGDAEEVQEWSAEAVEGDETTSELFAFGAPDGYSGGTAMGLYGAGAFAMAAPVPAITTAFRASLVL